MDKITRSKRVCCVVGCRNTETRNPELNFYRFPGKSYEKERKKKWIIAVNRITPEGKRWSPTSESRVCSAHFVGGKKSENMDDAAYIPTLFPSIIYKHKPYDDQTHQLNIPSRFRDDTDPLEISADDSLTLFGDSAGNIEFVVESSDDEPMVCDAVTKKNPVAVQVPGLNTNKQQLVVRKDLTRPPATIKPIIDIDLTSDLEDIKEEIKMEEDIIEVPVSDNENSKISKDAGNVSKQGEPKNKCIAKKKNTRCYYPDCTVDEKEDIIFFKAPYDQNLRKVWDVCIDRVDKRLDVEDVVCHKHFSKADLIYNVDDNGSVHTKLKDDAIPCLEFYSECCVPTCKATTGRMFCFPVQNTSNFHLWLYMIKNPALKNLRTKEVLKYRVCERHFEADCFNRDRTLTSAAAPTIHLPEYNIASLSLKLASPEAAPVPPTLNCAYLDCLSTSLIAKNMFKFPEDPNKCIAWLKACKRGGLITTPQATVSRVASRNLGVCEKHFGQHQFETPEKLKPDAIPLSTESLEAERVRASVAFPAEDSGSVNDSVLNEYSEKGPAKSFTGICSYSECRNKASADNPFFSFPVDPERSQKWLVACGLSAAPSSYVQQIIKSLQICSRHFKESMFESKYRLKSDAIPIQYRKRSNVSQAPPESLEIKNKANQNRKFDPSKIIYCAVSTCPNNYGISPGKGKFPNPSQDIERFNMWVKLLDNVALNALSPEEIYRKYMVCLKHFEPQFYMKDGKVGSLCEEAVPTRHLTADIQWFFSSDYYKNRVEKYLNEISAVLATDTSRNSRLTQSKEDREKLNKGDGSTICILEENGIRFPKTGHHLYVERQPNSKRKFPYGVYKFFKTGYGLNEDIMVGENIRIHTAIIIDDDDECERQVLQQLLDKRKKM